MRLNPTTAAAAAWSFYDDGLCYQRCDDNDGAWI